MHDHRMIGGTALGGVEFPDRIGIAGIGAETINRFSRKRDQSAPLEDCNGLRELEAVKSRTHAPVNMRSTSRYFSEVFVSTSDGKWGAGGFLFHGCVSSQSRTICLSNDGGLTPVRY